MKKKTTLFLEPEVDDLCDLLVQVIGRSQKGGDDASTTDASSPPEDGRDGASAAPTQPNN